MANKKWYYRINLADKTAIEYIQIPAVWANCSGLDVASEETIADMNWAGYNEGFLSRSAALSAGVSQAELDRVLPLAQEVAKEYIRIKRNKLIDASDKAVQVDRWEEYTEDQKNNIKTYRQALRNMTSTSDLFNPEWPAIPDELAFLNSVE